MRHLPSKFPLAAQVIFLVATCALLVAGAALAGAGPYRLRIVPGVLIAALGAVVLAASLAARVVRSLHELRQATARIADGDLTAILPEVMPGRELHELRVSFDHMVGRLRVAQQTQEESRAALASRSRAVDRLLEFSQTIQGAGQSQQVYAALAHFLEAELGLVGLVLVTHEPDQLPPINVRVAWPENLLDAAHPLAEMDPALCPCLRQNIARHFGPDNSPIRCAIDQSVTLPASHPAYCIPFHVGRRMQGVVHMVLPPGQAWTEDRCNLAQTYVNAACSCLIALRLLEEAEQQSLTDALTGLYNRHSMERLLQREVALAERHALPLSLVMIDVDLFKQINDAPRPRRRRSPASRVRRLRANDASQDGPGVSVRRG